ncbi:aminodeoxychorismate synthase component I [Aquimarina brevivitae]|uniref:Para-aminobenzoate synthetase component 1 n=1 Tax=Aquimarina brevivitae TaxID=323412 RepID=A0A4Q7P1N9_9FLAO|nr:aminodeoxychorismate synthase component I [Aquimarina brevivitae]RZS92562.1 para-aminobenzoate synthetase component 1 [Aquimarina brevivitae]
MRTEKQFTITNIESFKQKSLYWAQRFDDILFLDSNTHHDIHGAFDFIIAVDAFTALKTDYKDAFKKLEEYQSLTNDWLFGYISYDLKNDTEHLVSENYDGLGFADLYFFQPKKIIFVKGNKVTFAYLKMVDDEAEADYKEILATEFNQEVKQKSDCERVKISVRMTKDVYKEKVNSMLAHIHRGDIYEANFCQEFYAENSCIDPYLTYQHLNSISTPPFAAFFKNNDAYVLSASPERYLRKKGTKVISQPIKGTAKRASSRLEDDHLRSSLANDSKERSENIMIVDLVRNDLSKTALKGSVKVEELCKVYTFKQVHQMISTVSSEVAVDCSPVKIIESTFPMGSMTGAPKVSAMKIIEELEDTKRGVYSGAIGYFNPKGDFDFNVVIRSILYNSTKKYISYSVGGAITAKSNPDKEYEECLVKAKAMREVLEQQ